VGVLALVGTIGGSASAEIGAPIAEVYAIAADVEGSPRWQPEIKLAECVERDGAGNQVLVRMETDAKVRRLGSTIRFEYEEPARIRWVQEEGDLKAVEGSWELEELGSGRTRATYRLEVDLGRMLGMVIRGPVVGVLRGQLVDSMPEKLKGFAEGQRA
jgi:ribosome-associated toxin RatA of RatAB toxin-antitoxin module